MTIDNTWTYFFKQPDQNYPDLNNVNQYTDQTEKIKKIQKRLIALRCLEPGEADGIYGPKTQKAINKFRRVRDIASSGDLDKRTLEELFSTRKRDLLTLDHQSDFTKNVRSLQQKLKDFGKYTGPIDGVLGPETRQAIKAFQRANGLTIDGVVGPETTKALKGKIIKIKDNTGNILEIAYSALQEYAKKVIGKTNDSRANQYNEALREVVGLDLPTENIDGDNDIHTRAFEKAASGDTTIGQLLVGGSIGTEDDGITYDSSTGEVKVTSGIKPGLKEFTFTKDGAVKEFQIMIKPTPSASTASASTPSPASSTATTTTTSSAKLTPVNDTIEIDTNTTTDIPIAKLLKNDTESSSGLKSSIELVPATGGKSTPSGISYTVKADKIIVETTDPSLVAGDYIIGYKIYTDSSKSTTETVEVTIKYNPPSPVASPASPPASAKLTPVDDTVTIDTAGKTIIPIAELLKNDTESSSGLKSSIELVPATGGKSTPSGISYTVEDDKIIVETTDPSLVAGDYIIGYKIYTDSSKSTTETVEVTIKYNPPSPSPSPPAASTKLTPVNDTIKIGTNTKTDIPIADLLSNDTGYKGLTDPEKAKIQLKPSSGNATTSGISSIPYTVEAGKITVDTQDLSLVSGNYTFDYEIYTDGSKTTIKPARMTIEYTGGI